MKGRRDFGSAASLDLAGVGLAPDRFAFGEVGIAFGQSVELNVATGRRSRADPARA